MNSLIVLSLSQLWNRAANTDLPPSFSGFSGVMGSCPAVGYAVSCTRPDPEPASTAKAGIVFTKVLRSIGHLLI